MQNNIDIKSYIDKIIELQEHKNISSKNNISNFLQKNNIKDYDIIYNNKKIKYITVKFKDDIIIKIENELFNKKIKYITIKVKDSIFIDITKHIFSNKIYF